MPEKLPEHRLCPWWMAYTFDNPLRKLVHSPPRLFGEYVQEGMTVADIGCGMGYFSLGMARLVGDSGRVFSLDIQQKMLNVVAGRARRKKLAETIRPLLIKPSGFALPEPADFVLTFWMVHEVLDQNAFFSDVADALKPGGRLFVAEPKGHVDDGFFEEEAKSAARAGLALEENPAVRFSRAAVFQKAE